jgi:hypothetical protein
MKTILLNLSRKRLKVNLLKLYKEDGSEAGFFDVCEWWAYWYPDDIFKEEPKQVIQIRELAKELLSFKR